MIPVKDKIPALPQWNSYRENLMTAEAAESLFNRNEVTGIAIVCGKISGNLEVLDLDCKYDHTGRLWDEFCRLTEDALPGLYAFRTVAKSVNNGYHLYYFCEETEGNRKLARNDKNEVLIETRGEGGYVLAAPSPGYSFIKGGAGNIPVITKKERRVLMSIAGSFDERAAVKNELTDEPEWHHGLSPFEDYNQRGDVVRLLEKHGWKIVRQQGERIHLLRPGKERGVSANFHTGKRIFYPFSSSTVFESDRGYNPAGVYALLEAGSDFSAASKQLYSGGFGDRYPDKVHSFLGTDEKTKKLPPLQPFPVEGFPPELQHMINTCSEIYRTPRDYWAGAVLTASALGMGSKLELLTKYRNVPVIWLVLVGDVSSGKSNPLDFCLSYFKKLDTGSIKRYDENLAEFNVVSKMTARERLAEGIKEMPEKPECFQYILNDFTPEAMVAAHKVNNRGLLIERDELKGWFDDFGRYSKSGEQSNMLTSWSGYNITYNRKTSGILNISKPCIMVCGGMQPDLLPALAADHRAENGFLSRMCAIYPDNTEKARYNADILPEEIRTEWENYLSRLVGLPEYSLVLSREAQDLYEEWYNHNAAMINDEESGYLKGVYGKLDIIALRTSIIIRGMNMAFGDLSWGEIAGEEMKAALEITEYFRAAALKVYRRIFLNCGSDMLNKRNVAWYLYKEIGMKKADIAKTLGTSRSQLDRVLNSVDNRR